MSILQESTFGQPHYAYVTRMALTLFAQGLLPNVEAIEVEPEYGYWTRITYHDGSTRITFGNDTGTNKGSACELAKDKDFTKAALDASGIRVPEGGVFLLEWWADTIRESQNQRGHEIVNPASLAVQYANDIGLPVYIKPVGGSKGRGVEKVYDIATLHDVIESYEVARYRAFVVEQVIPFPDFRVVIFDDKLISAYKRVPLTVVGDGTSTVRELIEAMQRSFVRDGRDTILDPEDPRIINQLDRSGLGLDSVVDESASLQLREISNLSAGGTSVDLTEKIDRRWIDVARNSCAAIGLRLCGVDIACADLTKGDGDYAVIEVNGTPGLDHFASSGADQQRIVEALYAAILNTPGSD